MTSRTQIKRIKNTMFGFGNQKSARISFLYQLFPPSERFSEQQPPTSLNAASQSDFL